MFQNGSELNIVIRNRVVDEYIYNEKQYTGFGHEVQTFVEGRRGSEYKIRYRNHTGRRQKIVLSVDGLNVMTGDNTWEGGYCVEPFATVEIPGWRKDSANVAAFEFSSIKDSYNQQNDEGVVTNIGVIGCRVFNEVYKPFTTFAPGVGVREWELRSTGWPNFQGNYSIHVSNLSNCAGKGTSYGANITNDSFTANYIEPEANVNVGTGWGDNAQFLTHTVYYDFEPVAATTLLLYYDDLKGLQRRGINIRAKHTTVPNAFPEPVGCPSPKRIR